MKDETGAREVFFDNACCRPMQIQMRQGGEREYLVTRANLYEYELLSEVSDKYLVYLP